MFSHQIKAINILQKCNLLTRQWHPHVIAEMNGYQFKVVKLEGEFVWHQYDNTDEVLIVIDGKVRIEFRDDYIDLMPGEMFFIPRGVEHKTSANKESKVLIIEPAGVLNTDDQEYTDRTVIAEDWI